MSDNSSQSSSGQDLLGAGNILQGLGSIYSGIMQDAAYSTDADVAMQEARQQASIDDMKRRQEMGRVQGAYAAGGIDVNQGSPLAVMANTAFKGELQKSIDIYRGEVTAANDKFMGGNSLIGGIIGGIGKLAQGGAALAPMILSAL